MKPRKPKMKKRQYQVTVVPGFRIGDNRRKKKKVL